MEHIKQYFVSGVVVLLLICIVVGCMLIFPQPMQFYPVDDWAPTARILELPDNFTEIEHEIAALMVAKRAEAVAAAANGGAAAANGGAANQHEVKVIEAVIYDEGDATENAAAVPQTYEFLRGVAHIKRVAAVELGSTTAIKQSRGTTLDNDYLRLLLPVSVPGVYCKMWVDGMTKTAERGQLLMYDNSRENCLENKNKRHAATMLLIDVERPTNARRGIGV